MTDADENHSPVFDESAASALKASLFTSLVTDALTEYAYDAEVAGLSYDVHTNGNALTLSISGYNDKLPVLLKVVLEKLKTLQVDPQRFDLIKDQVRSLAGFTYALRTELTDVPCTHQTKRRLENVTFSSPYQLATYHMSYLTIERMWRPEDRLAVIDGRSKARLLPERRLT
jgi:insulysin